MKMIKRIRIRSYETGIYFRDGEFQGILDKGRYWWADPMDRVRVDVVSRRRPWVAHQGLDVLVRSKALDGRAEVLDLKDHQRALVWIDGRFEGVLVPGLYALWNDLQDVRTEIVDAATVRFDHPAVNVIARWSDAAQVFHVSTVDQGWVGVCFKDGVFETVLSPGHYLFWRKMAKVKL